jgi:hypothetical protein
LKQFTDRQQGTEKDPNMTRDDIFPSKYLKAADLKGNPHVVTIERAPFETLKSLDGQETQKIVLYFAKATKSLPLNLTNFDSVCDATGQFDTEDWLGQQIDVYPSRTLMGGKTVDCIRIRAPSASRPAAAAAPPPPPPLATADMDDEIPF